MRYKIIHNPMAGSGNGARLLPSILDQLRNRGLDFELSSTEYAGHAIHLAEHAVADGFDVIVAAGGDGTANEVINGLLSAKKVHSNDVALAVISTGRGNDFAYGANIPTDLSSAIDLLHSNHRTLIDIGFVIGGDYPEGRYFGNCVGVGFDAVTTIEVAKLPRFGGFLSFLIAVLRTIFLYYRGPVVRITCDGEELSLGTLLISIMNGKRLGDGFWMAPDAIMDDGIFDLCIAKQVNRRRILTLIPHFMRGTQATQEEIITMKGKHIILEAVEGVLPAQTDGEILCVDGKSLQIELLPQHLAILTPPLEQPT